MKNVTRVITEPTRIIKTTYGYFVKFCGDYAIYSDDIKNAFRFYCGIESANYTASFLQIPFEILEFN